MMDELLKPRISCENIKPAVKFTASRLRGLECFVATASRMSVTLKYCDDVGWMFLKIISWLVCCPQTSTS